MFVQYLLSFIAFAFLAGECLGDTCSVAPSDRVECGWAGIPANTCVQRGCCFDNSIVNVKWCFQHNLRSCSVTPAQRTECGWAGIPKDTCTNRGCCFDNSIPNVKWCFNPVYVYSGGESFDAGTTEASAY